jgi:hypothetical protein
MGRPCALRSSLGLNATAPAAHAHGQPLEEHGSEGEAGEGLDA